ncbi:MAG: uracil-DNA glycosylase [Saprospirales bacterium]|nr:MAG: uracil-DNA glycosylase [Saprospirales bacterium]
MGADKVKIEADWKEVLRDEFEKPYFERIRQFLKSELHQGKKIYPPGPKIFNAFDSTPFNDVKAVVIGQDPYHGPGQAMGLSFSVPRGVRPPPSLNNIYKELKSDLGIDHPGHGDLTKWTKQGVFLLNAILTVEHKKAGSHRKIGWEQFTDAVIKNLSEKRKNLVFLLWGRFARSKISLIDQSKHCVLESPHPSPLAGNAFLGNRHFSKTNNMLRDHSMGEIDWSLD